MVFPGSKEDNDCIADYLGYVTSPNNAYNERLWILGKLSSLHQLWSLVIIFYDDNKSFSQDLTRYRINVDIPTR
jgi:hypothetical protein